MDPFADPPSRPSTPPLELVEFDEMQTTNTPSSSSGRTEPLLSTPPSTDAADDAVERAELAYPEVEEVHTDLFGKMAHASRESGPSAVREETAGKPDQTGRKAAMSAADDEARSVSPGILRQMFDRKHCLSRVDERSQYTTTTNDAAGVSSCGPTSLNGMRIAFDGVTTPDKAVLRLQHIILHPSRFLNTALEISPFWKDRTHREVSEMYEHCPLFKESFQSLQFQQFLLTKRHLREALSLLSSLAYRQPARCASAVITRPPETVSVFVFPTGLESPYPAQIFGFCDSHPRPGQPGAVVMFFPSMESIVDHLSRLFAIDRVQQLDGDDEGYFYGGMNQFRFDYYAPKRLTRAVASPMQRLYQSSLDQMKVYFEGEDEKSKLRDEVRMLKREVWSGKQELDMVKSRAEVERLQLREQLDAAQHSIRSLERFVNERDGQGQALPGAWPGAQRSRPADGGIRATAAAAREVFMDRFRTRNETAANTGLAAPPPQAVTPYRRPANDLPPQFEDLVHELPPHYQEYATEQESSLAFSGGQLGEDDGAFARRVQREEEATARFFQQEQEEALRNQFNCPVCLDDHHIHQVAINEPCGHRSCRDCLHGHICTQVRQNLVPICCLQCTEQVTPSTVETILDALVDANILHRYHELLLDSCSVPVRCPRGGHTIRIATEDVQRSWAYSCPICDFVWCKKCSQGVLEREEHSCNGDLEMERLAIQEGWQKCPVCGARHDKITGCNHITCRSAGCTAHYCWICGNLICKGLTSATAIQAAVSRHYSGACKLFDVPPERR